MAFDGVTVAGLVHEMQKRIQNGRISKIAQPEDDELLLTIKVQKEACRLLMSANASLPLLYFTDKNKISPATAPGFCMLLRKHIGNGRIIDISQPGLERIIDLTIEHLNEMGDLCIKHLIIELMGKHSNIIFCNQDYQIIDSIKHVSALVSSVREVLPGRPYFIPETMHKKDPLTLTEDAFAESMKTHPYPLYKALYTSFTGLSPVMGTEICHRAGISPDVDAGSLSSMELLHLYKTMTYLMEDIKNGCFHPQVIFQDSMPVEFSAIPLECYGNSRIQEFSSVSELLEYFYAARSQASRIHQKSADLRRIVQTNLERSLKKFDLQKKQLKDTQKRDRYKLYGELIHTYGYSVEEGSDKMQAWNYYDDNKEITIPLDPDLTAAENAKRYFEKYNKQKRTFEALTRFIEETEAEIEYLRSVSNALDISVEENDLTQIKEELREAGYIKKRGPKEKKARFTSSPFHYVTEDGFHLYAGRNNYQNEELTFHFATGGDWWFHSKKAPGSHIILKNDGREIPDHVFELAGSLAAYYSSARSAEKVEIDYIQKKQVKKVAGAKPGFVIYHTNYSMMAEPSLKELTEVKD
ncbi:MAG: NFACT RNA binding domain-containing protein [Lachnospiraceae bacterium]|nr:NFACT RNA binding domain-containing protein [Lachnospiraceae bacterium]